MAMLEAEGGREGGGRRLVFIVSPHHHIPCIQIPITSITVHMPSLAGITYGGVIALLCPASVMYTAPVEPQTPVERLNECEKEQSWLEALVTSRCRPVCARALKSEQFSRRLAGTAHISSQFHSKSPLITQIAGCNPRDRRRHRPGAKVSAITSVLSVSGRT